MRWLNCIWPYLPNCQVLLRKPDSSSVLVFVSLFLLSFTKTRLFKYFENFYNNKKKKKKKNVNTQMKYSGSFHISSQNIECGYLLEAPRRGISNEYPHVFEQKLENLCRYCKPQSLYKSGI